MGVGNAFGCMRVAAIPGHMTDSDPDKFEAELFDTAAKCKRHDEI